jgi:hypothetical protein
MAGVTDAYPSLHRTMQYISCTVVGQVGNTHDCLGCIQRSIQQIGLSPVDSVHHLMGKGKAVLQPSCMTSHRAHPWLSNSSKKMRTRWRPRAIALQAGEVVLPGDSCFSSAVQPTTVRGIMLTLYLDHHICRGHGQD